VTAIGTGRRPGATRLAERIQEVQALTRRWFLMLRRERLSLLFSIAQPAVWLVFFSSAVGRTVDPGVIGDDSYLHFTLPGVAVFTVVGNGVSGAMPLLWDKETGYLDKLLTTPLARSSILISRILAQIVIGSAQVLIVLAIAAMLGVWVGVPVALLFVLVAALVTVATTSAALALAYSVRGHETFFAVSGFLTIPLMFLSTAFVPASAMNQWFGAIASGNPVSFAVQAIRGAMTGDPASSIIGLVVSFCFAAVCLTLAVLVYRRRTSERA
jgi:ABC-2 type transport system permease protein